jgi:hypothetical protein
MNLPKRDQSIGIEAHGMTKSSAVLLDTGAVIAAP